MPTITTRAAAIQARRDVRNLKPAASAGANSFRIFYKEFGLNIEAHQTEWEEALSQENKVRIAAPRSSGKTTFLMHRLAWEIGKQPAIRIIIASASEEIAASISVAVRTIVESEIFRNIFPKIIPSKKWADHRWEINRQAAGVKQVLKDPTVLGVGMSGSITSRRADLIVIDDPIKSSKQIETQKSREGMRDWWHEVLKPTGGPNARAWVICTRYRKDDIHGTEFTEEKGFRVISQRAIIAKEDGDPASYWEAMFPLSWLLKTKAENPEAFQSQYQNEPVTRETAIYRPEWMTIKEAPQSLDMIVIGVDLASAKESGSYTALVAAGRHLDQRAYSILLARRGRWTIHETAKELFKLQDLLSDRSRAFIAVVEEVALQSEFTMEFKRLALEEGRIIRIEGRRPKGSKEQRQQGVAGLFEGGAVSFAHKMQDLEQELLGFGYEATSDLADGVEIALRRLYKARGKTEGGQYENNHKSQYQ